MIFLIEDSEYFFLDIKLSHQRINTVVFFLFWGLTVCINFEVHYV